MINIAELLKDCPRGMELDSPLFEGLEFDADKLITFFHENHIDYRGLIDKGLAIDATNKNIY